MKKIYLLLFGAILLCSCKNQLTEIERIAQSDPIKPIMLQEDETHIFLTDYVPTLSVEDIDSIFFDGIEQPVAAELDLYTLPQMGNFVHQLVVMSKGHSVEIPALAPLKQKQELITIGATDHSVDFVFYNGADEAEVAMYWQNKALDDNLLTINEQGVYHLEIPKYKHSGRSFIRVYATDKNFRYNDLLIPLKNMKPIDDVAMLNRHDQQAQLLYSLMIDRFFDGKESNNMPLNQKDVLPIVDYMGGDIVGIKQKIEEGFFDELGVNTIWISPITQNPLTAWGYYPFDAEHPCKYKDIDGEQPLYTKFSGYHGYWPIYTTQIDSRLGTDDELRQMLSVAHKHGINVVLDYVANHVHIESPIMQAHPDWVTDSLLPDGRRNFELWDEARLTTWFDKHIPTLDLEREEVYQPMTDSALTWLERFDLDGFRHDACKHIPECYWRTLTQKMRTRYADRSLWMIGETYGSPELIGSYVKTGMLDAQFDFNVFYTVRDALIAPNGSMKKVGEVIEESLAAYGAHHTMGNISGNHDNGRFISFAGGALSVDEDAKQAGWSREVGVGDAEVAYKRAMLLEVINLTIPGVPCIYQGDEYAVPGGNDPDNRHLMQFDGYSEQQQNFHNELLEVIGIRKHSMPLLYGDYVPVEVTDDVLCFKRIYLGDIVTVAINRSAEPKTILADDIELTIPALGYVIR